MSKELIGIDLDMDLNQLLNSRAENGTGFATGGAGSKGRFMYDTTSNRLLYDDGVAIQSVANLNDVAGLLDFKGGYNATTDTPAIAGGVGVLKGDYYVVTVAGTFLGVVVEVGDSLFANQDAPTIASQWTIVQGNVVMATETVAGVVKIATQVLTDAGVDDTTAITPKKLKDASYLPNKYTSPGTVVGGGGPGTVITHNLNNAQPGGITILNSGTGAPIRLRMDTFTANTFTIYKNGANITVTVSVNG
jgi:hypothetical protein